MERAVKVRLAPFALAQTRLVPTLINAAIACATVELSSSGRTKWLMVVGAVMSEATSAAKAN